MRLRLIRVVAGLTLFLAAGAGAAGAGAPTEELFPPFAVREPTTEPLLRIEAGMHTAAINRISVDADNRFLVTGSTDKTVRVWSLADGALLRTIRPPSDIGNEGRIYAVALSPDGRIIAAGGYTGWDWRQSNTIYFFDRETGRLVNQIDGLPNVIYHLSFSRDGRLLVAGLYGGAGIRLYGAPDWREVAADRDYGDNCMGADFDATGRLVTSSFDGYLRLYAPPGAGRSSFGLLATQRAPGGAQPYHVAFSPDGTQIAVGYYDSTNVTILSGRDLAPLSAPDVTGVTNGNLSTVGWSRDGRLLSAGGMWQTSDYARPIRQWSGIEPGAYRDLPVARNTIMHFLPLNDGGLAVGTFDPAFGRFDAAGRPVFFRESSLADYRGLADGFRLSPDGSSVQFRFDPADQSPTVFSTTERRFLPAADAAALVAPVTTAAELRVENAINSPHPLLNGIPLPLDANERSLAYAIAPDRRSLLLGADWTLRRFHRDGTMAWSVPAPGAVWSVTVSGDGALVAAACADGTIRWYRMTDGRELLAFFPHRDRQRWVLWTPSGYYDASPGGEDLIGWQLNHGPATAADFFPASRFRDRYYRPDVIARVFDVMDEAEAVRVADAASSRRRDSAAPVASLLPPVIEIVAPADNAAVDSTAVRVRYRLRSPSGEPVTALRVLVDGRPVAAPSGLNLAARESEGELTVAVPEGGGVLSLIAENRFAASEASSVRVRWSGPAAAVADALKPKLYVLAVGVSRYEQADLRLRFPARDAADFARAVREQEGGLYRAVEVKTLTDSAASRDNLLDGLDWLQRQATARDVAMIFFAGHGMNDPAGIFYFLPVNADPDNLKRTCLPYTELQNTVQGMACKVVLFMDACHAGNVTGAGVQRRAAEADVMGLVNELASAENGVVVFAASTGRQYSMESAAWGNGAFTKAVVEGLRGGAAIGSQPRITLKMLDLYISERVKTLTEGRQTPCTIVPANVPDFPVAVKR